LAESPMKIRISAIFTTYLIREILADYKNQHWLKAIQGNHQRLLRSYPYHSQ
jgi:hypothetical protein